jgi:hypothetical protein
MRSVLPHGCTGVCATGIDDAGPGEYGEMDKGWTNLVNDRANVHAVAHKTSGRRGAIGVR